MNNNYDKKIEFAEKRIRELVQSGELKKLSQNEQYRLADFYESKCLRRMDTAKLIYGVSFDTAKQKINNLPNDYNDYGEAVTAAYYAMYYIVHAYLAKRYATKLREDARGVHAITHYLVLYYLVKTKVLASHLYEEYVKTFEAAAEVQKLSKEDFQEKAYRYAEKYDKSRSAREMFTYRTTASAEAYHAEQAIHTAEEFISLIRQVMIK